MSNSREQALSLSRLLDDLKAKDILLLSVSHLTVIAEYFILCSARSTLAVKAICDGLEEKAKEKLSITPTRRDGLSDARWIVLDYGSIIVHVFHDQEREFYNLERLWMDGSNRIEFIETELDESAQDTEGAPESEPEAELESELDPEPETELESELEPELEPELDPKPEE